MSPAAEGAGASPHRVPWGWTALLTAGLAAVASLKALFSVSAVASRGDWVHPVPAAVYFTVVALYAVTGAYLVVMGRRDSRAIPLGLFLLLVASSFSTRLLRAGVAGLPRLAPLLGLLEHIPVEAFLAFFLWRFVRDYPRRPVRAGAPVNAMLKASLAVGLALFTINILAPLGTPDGTQSGITGVLHLFETNGSLYWALIFAVMLPALPYALWKARWTGLDERRRVRILLASVVLGFSPTLLVVLLYGVWPAFAAWLDRPEGLRRAGLIMYPALLAIPLATAYAVLVHQALDVRLLLRRALRYALARYTILTIGTLPFVALAVLLYFRRNETLTDILVSRTGAFLLGGLGLGIAGLRGRRWLIESLDRRFFREQYDARRVLGALVERVPVLRNPVQLELVLSREIDLALHLENVHFLVLDETSHAFVSPSMRIRPLDPAASVAQRLHALGTVLDVAWRRPGEWIHALPRDEQQWLMDSGAKLLVPILTESNRLIGMLVLGEKRSELPFSGEDRLLLSAIAGALALALRASEAAAETPRLEFRPESERPASECAACGLVEPAEPGPCTRCGRQTSAAAVPPLLAAKFRVLSRLGEGGMGVVYRALDVGLAREVAIKTLPSMSVSHAARLRREARVMAAVMHPNLALIFGVESWRGAPMLIVEYLPGGTLESARAGPVPHREAIRIVSAVTAGLARLHAGGILHRDIKPSNIGFDSDGTAKLLDFGLAQMLASGTHQRTAPAWDAATFSSHAPSTIGERLAGTPAYLSPEAISRDQPDASWDLWALAVVLYQLIAGVNPFAGGHPLAVMARIERAEIPDVRHHAGTTPAPVARFLAEALSADRRRRPASAGQFGERLTRLLNNADGTPE